MEDAFMYLLMKTYCFSIFAGIVAMARQFESSLSQNGERAPSICVFNSFPPLFVDYFCYKL